MKPTRPPGRQRDAVACRVALAVAAFVTLSACEQNSFVPPPPPKVEVAQPLQHPITRYLEATGNTAAASFVYDTYDPSRVLISAGVGTLQGVFGIAPGDPLPRDVAPSSGQVLYRLTRAITGPPRTDVFTTDAYMLVQMTDDTHIRMQTFSPTAVPDVFTSAAGTFTR